MTDVLGALPASMRAAVLRAPGDVVVEERPVPVPGPGEVLVEVASVGICGSDVHYYRHGRIGEHVVRSPLVLGHEAGGRVVAVGSDVPEERLGERVSVEPGFPCRACALCRDGSYNLCPDVRFFGTPPVDGALCEYVVAPADFAHQVPDEVSDDAAGLLEPLSVALWAGRKAGLGSCGSVLVSGAGPIGLLVAAVAAAEGVAEVLVSDVDPDRLDRARRYGATRVLDARDPAALDGVAVDAFVDCSGVPDAVVAGVSAVRAGGTAVLVGMGADTVPLPVSQVQQREVVVTGTFRYAHTWPDAVRLAASGLVDLDGLVTGHVDLDRTAEALDPDPAAGHVKLVVRPSSGSTR